MDTHITCVKALTRLKEYGCDRIKSRNRFIKHPIIEGNQILGFFYGVEKVGLYGADMVIKLHLNHMYLLRMAVGKGTNPKE